MRATLSWMSGRSGSISWRCSTSYWWLIIPNLLHGLRRWQCCQDQKKNALNHLTEVWREWPRPTATLICGNNKIFALLNNCCRILLLLHWLQIWVGTFAAYSWYARSTACHVRSVWFLRLTSLRRFYRGYRCTYPRSLRGQRRISLFMATGSSRMRECAYLSIVIIIIHYKLIN